MHDFFLYYVYKVKTLVQHGCDIATKCLDSGLFHVLIKCLDDALFVFFYKSVKTLKLKLAPCNIARFAFLFCKNEILLYHINVMFFTHCKYLAYVTHTVLNSIKTTILKKVCHDEKIKYKIKRREREKDKRQFFFLGFFLCMKP
jgi:hypothetical protein